MLIGSGMENNFGTILLEDMVEALLIADISNDWREIETRILLFEFQSDVVERSLCIIEHKKMFHAESGELAAEFGTDGSGGTGHEDRLTAHHVADLGHVDFNFGATEEVFDFDISDRAGIELTILNLIDAWSEIGLDSQTQAGRYKAVFLFAGIGEIGEKDSFDIIVFADTDKIGGIFKVIYRFAHDEILIEFGAITGDDETFNGIVGRETEAGEGSDGFITDTVDEDTLFPIGR